MSNWIVVCSAAGSPRPRAVSSDLTILVVEQKMLDTASLMV